MTTRREKCFVGGPPGLKSLSDGVHSDRWRKQFIGSTQRQSHTPNSNNPVGFPVQRLLFSSGPSYIAWLVSALVVNSVKRVSRGWALPNMGQKLFKAISPFFANNNALGAISRKGWVCFPVTAGLHRVPYFVFRRFCSGLCVSVFEIVDLALTSTGRALRVPVRRQVVGPCNAAFPAIAQAIPIRLPNWGFVRKRNDSQHPKTTICFVIKNHET